MPDFIVKVSVDLRKTVRVSIPDDELESDAYSQASELVFQKVEDELFALDGFKANDYDCHGVSRIVAGKPEKEE